MAAIPTLGEEDARRPNREWENLLGERTRIVNRMKACLVRFGVRNFKSTLRKAPERLEALRTPEGGPLPPNSFAELRRDMVRLRFVMGQIKERPSRAARQARPGRHPCRQASRGASPTAPPSNNSRKQGDFPRKTGRRLSKNWAITERN